MYNRVVIKIGSSSITHEETGHISLSKLERFVRQVADLKNKGKEVIVVSSGAIAVGTSALYLKERPIRVAEKQAVAAVGQASLMMLYQKLFREYNVIPGQVLLTKDILSHPQREKNAQNTLKEMLTLGVVPIVNENDTIATEEIEFGDNDTLSAIVASLVKADLLMLLSDIDAVYDANPKTNPQAQPIDRIDGFDEALYALAGDSHTSLGTGGMVTKLDAAKIALDHGLDMVIMHADSPHGIERFIKGEKIGTLFIHQPERVRN